MRIAAITMDGPAAGPVLEIDSLTRGLNAIYGPLRSGKSALANLLGQTLFGKRVWPSREVYATPPGDVVVESGQLRYRVRRYQDGSGAVRLTVAALDGSPVDHQTIPKLVGGLSPTVLSPLCAVSFRQSPNLDHLLSPEFARGWQSIEHHGPGQSRRRAAELTARRDLLAQELETRIAGERRVSQDLEARARELDRLGRDEQQQAREIEQRLRAVETALAETDARLRYRRLELNVDFQWRQPGDACDSTDAVQELDRQITRWRTVLAELAQREADARAQLSQHEAARANGADAVDCRSWLAMARQLSADLAGEVARLARASASEQCVCHDAHPRLRPIAETIGRQLDRFENLVADQQRVAEVAKLQTEAGNLSRSQVELRRHLDHLLDERQAATPVDSSSGKPSFSAADAEQLESRRIELEQERFELAQRFRIHSETLRKLREERDAIDRERAAVLSARSIEHVQRELNAVQQKLEQAAAFEIEPLGPAILTGAATTASDFLAQLTDGGLVRLLIDEPSGHPCVVNRSGETIRVESLMMAERDQVYLSICLARLSAASRQGIWLPLVLDEPFERLDPRATAALTAVLDAFSRQGHQVLVFTSKTPAIERLHSIGATMHDVTLPRRTIIGDTVVTQTAVTKKRKPRRRSNSVNKTNVDHQSDAA